MLIEVNRGSVCMGDDCEDHRFTIDIDTKATIGQILANVLTSHFFLPTVSGPEVGWLAQIVLRSADSWYQKTTADIALLQMSDSRHVDVTPLSPYWLSSPLESFLRRGSENDQFALYFNYLSDGRRRSLEDFCAPYVSGD